MKKILPFLLIIVLLFSANIPAFAESNPSPKEEIVYGILDLNGSVANLYVVNIFSGGLITDYGNYSEIRNLASAEKLGKNGDKITINTKAEKFYYQGTLEKKELPWDIAINYFIDGKEIPPKELAGKSGQLKIAISVKQNKNADSIFFETYALQISLSLDNRICSDIKANNATITEAGGKKQLTYTALPGKGIDISVTANVRDFEMEPVAINGIRLALDIPVDSSEFEKQISDLTGALGTLDDGAGELLDGFNRFSDGMQKYIDGLKAFKSGLGRLSEGADKLDEGANALKNGLSMLANQNDSLVNGALAIQKATFDSVNSRLAEMGPGFPVLTPQNYSEVLSRIPDLADIKNQLDGVVQFTEGLKGYTEGVARLEKGASDLAGGTAEFKSSSAVIASSANELYTAGAELNAAVKKLQDGLASYKDGTKELRDGTSGMNSEINKKINELIGSISGKDGKTVSFVSEKNTEVSHVQFVLKTHSIDLPEVRETVAEKTVELTFWQKLLKLFGLYK